MKRRTIIEGMKRGDMLKQLAEAVQQVEVPHPLRVAIDGMDAAGKTILADELATVLKYTQRQIIRASVDGFHHPEHLRRQKGSLSPEGFYFNSYNYMAMIDTLLIPLGPGGNLQYRKSAFNYQLNQAKNSPLKTAKSNAVLLMDGIFMLRAELLPYWDLTIYLDVSFNTVLERGVSRDAILFGSPQKAAERYHKRYIPGQQIYLQKANPLDKADILVDNNNLDEPELLRIYMDSKIKRRKQ